MLPPATGNHDSSDDVESGEHLARKPAGKLDVNIYTHGLDPDRQFPAIIASFTVQRRPGFYLVNVALPMLIFSFLSLFSFGIPWDPNDSLAR